MGRPLFTELRSGAIPVATGPDTERLAKVLWDSYREELELAGPAYGMTPVLPLWEDLPAVRQQLWLRLACRVLHTPSHPQIEGLNNTIPQGRA